MSLPMEILHIIFSQLGGEYTVRCRRVCRLWRDAVDSMSDRTWKEIFLREIGKKEFLKMPTLSWKEMYKSISLWAHVEFDVITSNELKAPHVLQCKVLNNGIVSVMLNINGDVVSRVRGYGDTIIHFDLDTYQEVNRECFKFLFSDYSENENYISAIDMDQNLCIILKANKQIFHVGKLLAFFYHSRGIYTPCLNEVYFKNIYDIICIAKVVEENGEVTVRTLMLDEFKKQVLAFSVGSKDDFYILSIEGSIFEYKNKKFELVSAKNDYSPQFYYNLDFYGFDWSSPAILFWILDSEDSYLLGESKSEVSAICRHRNVVIRGTYSRDIKIYYNPFKVNGDLKTEIKPNRYISMYTYDPLKTHVRSANSLIQQLFVMEKLNGHKLIVLSAHKVFVLDFDFDYNEVKNKVKVIRKHSHSNTKEAKLNNLSKEVYNTRSSTAKSEHS